MLKGKFSLLASSAAALTLAAGCACAGGPDPIPLAHALPMYNPNVYIQADFGYANLNRNDVFQRNFTDNGKGGFTVGGAVGYSFMPNLAVEIGGFYLPEATHTGILPPLFGNVSSWVVDAMAKLSVPVADEFSIFGQAGVGYRSVDNHHRGNKTGSYWCPMFGAGIEYQFTANFYSQVEYIRIPSNQDNSNPQNTDAAANTYTFNLGYQFDV